MLDVAAGVEGGAAPPPFSRRNRISFSTCRFQAKSYSPVCSTERAAETASPPPFISMVSKSGRLGSW